MIRYFTNLYPRTANPQCGIFIKEQLDELAKVLDVELFVYKSTFPPITENWKTYAAQLSIEHENTYSVEEFDVLDFPKHFFLPFTLRLITKNLSELNWAKVKLVHIHFLYPGILATPFLIKHSIPFILHVHGSDWSQYRSRKRLKKLLDISLDKAKKIVFSGIENYTEAQQLYGDKCMYLPNGINYKIIDAVKANQKEEKPTAICVANVTAIKGLHRLKQIANMKTASSWMIKVYGKIIDKSIQKDIEQSFENSMHSVRFYDAQPKPIVIEAMKKAHVFLHTSEKESFGLALTEALYLGLPVIGTDTGILKSITAHSGLLKTTFLKNDDVIDFLNQHEKGGMYKESSMQVREYSMDNYVKKLVKLYAELDKS